MDVITEKKPTLAILEGNRQTLLQAPGWVSGDPFYAIRSSLGKAVTNVLIIMKNRFRIELKRNELEKMFYEYVNGVIDGKFVFFTPDSSDAVVETNAQSVVSYVGNFVNLPAEWIYFAFAALWMSARDQETGSSDVLKPTKDTLTVMDKLQEGSVGTAIGGLINQTAEAVGLNPSTLKGILYVGGAAVGAVLLNSLYQRTKPKAFS